MRSKILTVFALCLVPVSAAQAATISDLAADVSMSNLQNHVTALSGDRASIAGRNAARGYIATQLQSYGYTTSVDAKGNIIAGLPGVTNPSKIYVVGAHFDAVNGAPGADDNASGVAGMLEIARIFSTQHFDSTIRFIGFDQEEIGLVGSRAYAQGAAALGENIALATVFDMIGYTSPTQTPFPTGDAGQFGSFNVSEIRLVGDFIGVLGANNPQTLAAYVNAASQYAPTLPVVTGILAANNLGNPNTQAIFSNLYRSDHVGFWLNGYSAILLGDTANFRSPHYHGATDLPSTLDFPFMTQVVKGSVGFLAGQAGFVPVPEPGTNVLLAFGLLSIVTIYYRRTRVVVNPA